MFSWITRMIKGLIIALGFILPGVSGGVLAAILGIYERMISFLAHIKDNFKENVLFFLPVGIGMILGIALFSLPVEYLLAHYKIIVLWGFAGAIIGTIPSLVKESVRESDRDRIDIAIFWLTFVLSGFFLYFLNSMVGTLPANFLTFTFDFRFIHSNADWFQVLRSFWNIFTNCYRRCFSSHSFFKNNGLCTQKFSFASLSFHYWYCAF